MAYFERLTELEAMTDEVLTCQQVAMVLKASPATIHKQAMECPEKLGFPVIVMGSRVKIPRRAFIMFLKGANFNACESMERRTAQGNI